IEHMNVAVAKRIEAAGRQHRHAIVFVAQNDRSGESRHQPSDIELDAAIGQGYGIEQMAFTKLPGLAHVEQCDLAALMKAGFQCQWIEPTCHDETQSRQSIVAPEILTSSPHFGSSCSM